jgi:putative ABC transport system ATP-binding protein
MTASLEGEAMAISGVRSASGNGKPLIRIAGLNYFFGQGEARKQVLFDNNLEVMPGEIVIMTGPSGSGKTTLLTLIGALRTVQDGVLEVDGKPLGGLCEAELVQMRRHIGFIFQAHNLFSSLSALQNVCMALQLHNGASKNMSERATESLTALGLGHRIHYKPENLSGGQRQRVAIARALSHRPKLILADEPTAALDAASGRDVVNLLKRLAEEERSSILIVTHDNRILDVADRIVNMVDGRIVSNVLVKESVSICLFLSKCEVFAGLNVDALTKVAEKMSIERYPAGATIIRQGEEGDKFYLLRRGTVDVYIDDADGKPQFVNTMKEGDFFGERALLSGQVRSATIVAKEAVETYTLDKAEFQAALASIGSFKQQIYKAYFQRQ